MLKYLALSLMLCCCASAYAKPSKLHFLKDKKFWVTVAAAGMGVVVGTGITANNAPSSTAFQGLAVRSPRMGCTAVCK